MTRLETVLHQAHRGRQERKWSRWQGVGTEIDCGGGWDGKEGVEGCKEGGRGKEDGGEAGSKVD